MDLGSFNWIQGGKNYPAKAQMVEHDPETLKDLHAERYSNSGHVPEVFDLTALTLYQ